MNEKVKKNPKIPPVDVIGVFQIHTNHNVR